MRTATRVWAILLLLAAVFVAGLVLALMGLALARWDSVIGGIGLMAAAVVVNQWQLPAAAKRLGSEFEGASETSPTGEDGGSTSAGPQMPGHSSTSRRLPQVVGVAVVVLAILALVWGAFVGK